MDRRASMVGIATAAGVLVVALAASAGPSRLWVTPPSNESPAPGGTAPGSTIPPIIADEVSTATIDLPDWVGGALQIVAFALVAMIVVAYLASDTWGPRVRLVRRIKLIRRGTRGIDALPRVPESGSLVDVDVAAARHALASGSPRNAIVACWMQLERGAAAAGLARVPAETPTEYVERVVASASIDPAPVGELAALYREARFSRHELSEAHRARAAAALARTVAALHLPVGAPT